MSVLPADVFIGNIFLSLEAFLQKTAAMDIFDVLLFDYKMKPNLATSHLRPSSMDDFVGYTEALNHQLQEATQKYISDMESKVAVEIIQVAFNEENNVANTKFVVNDETLSSDSYSISQDLDEEENTSENIMEDMAKTRKKGLLKRNCTQTSTNTTLKSGTSKNRPEARIFKNTKSTKKSSETSCCEWQCNFCERVFASYSKLTLHITMVHNQTVQSDITDECAMSSDFDKEKSNKGDIDYDVELDRASLSLFCCQDCVATYKTLTEFIAHECDVSTDLLEEENDQPVRQGVERLMRSWEQLCSLRSLICGQCLEEYRSLRRMVHHLPRCKPGPYTCELCPTAFPNKRELNYHKKKMHINEKCFFCEECSLSFKLRTSLQKHLVQRHENNQGPFACEDCGKTFSKKIHLTNHRSKEHELQKNFLCQVCGNKFSTQSSLTAHLETHTGRKRFSCSYCRRKFQRKEKLIFHTRIHTGERPFECKICHKSFIRKSKLDEHARRHEGEKRFECNVCNKKYAAAWDLRQHVKKQHSVKEESSSTSQEEEEDSSSKSDPLLPTTSVPVLSVVEPAQLEVVNPNIISTELTGVTTGPTIMAVETLQISALDGPTSTQFILPPNTQIQMPISMTQSFDISNQQGQQILLTSIGNFDVTGAIHPNCNYKFA